jgi:hypothetical protein
MSLTLISLLPFPAFVIVVVLVLLGDSRDRLRDRLRDRWGRPPRHRTRPSAGRE